MVELIDHSGAHIKSGFYRSIANPDNISYLDLENLKILQPPTETEMSAFLCSAFYPINPKEYLKNLEATKNFISSKLENLTKDNKANLSSESLENTSRKVRTDDFSYE